MIERRSIEACSQPTVKGMARFAGSSKLRAGVGRIGRFLILLQVARCASRRKTLELPNRSALVAVLALHGGVSAEKREAILVILNLLNGIVPTENRVALRAVRAHFPLVNVGVAVLAILADVGKDWLGVALHALHFFVHAAKRIFGVVVIEFRHGLDRTPTRSGVTVLAWNRERPVRTLASLPLRGERSSRSGA